GAFAAAVARATHDQRPNILAGRDLRDQAWSALGAPTADAARIKEKLAQARTLEFAARGRIEDAVVDFAAGLPQAQRAGVGQELRPQAKPAQPPR
ncbi:MAG TPA: periplasmic heavy metal sensor, partial [Caulobacteraceae bacterium]|nr:periplasmic heavy metal sensor [Caulobacteraceae bacterium]